MGYQGELLRCHRSHKARRTLRLLLSAKLKTATEEYINNNTDNYTAIVKQETTTKLHYMDEFTVFEPAPGSLPAGADPAWPD